MKPVWVNVGCGPFRAPKPWANLDVHEGDGIEPDIVVEDPLVPLRDWPDGSVHRVYLGHVLEHVAWHGVPAFLADIQRAMRPGGELAVVGPDVFRTIEMAAAGRVPESKLAEVLENDSHFQRASGSAEWDQARHHWNAYEGRVVRALADAGFESVVAERVEPGRLSGWPLVSHEQDQCAVLARCP